MTLDFRAVDLERLNSLTKYPSIPNYHALDPKNGGLTDEVTAFTGPVLLTEKVDGTNARIVLNGDGGYLIGSRAEFLYARGDLIGNPALGIVEAVRTVAERAAETLATSSPTVVFGEVYGGKVTQASKQYTGAKRVGFRLFDVVKLADDEDRLASSPEEISQWRESGGQSFYDEPRLVQAAKDLGVELTPRLETVESLPKTIDEANDFLRQKCPSTRVALDEGAGGAPEGIVVRSLDRSVIAKMRFADYRRTLKRRK